MDELVTLSDVEGARDRIMDSVHRTPLLSSRLIGDRVGAPLFLKCENLQKTGSFKVRGALNHIRQLGPAARERGVVTISAGNHAQALAWAASASGVPSTVVMPGHAVRSKADASAGYGAEVILHGSVFEAFEMAEELARERNLIFVHPFDDAKIIAGQGTVGLEILEDLPDAETVIVPVGGGGLISGVAAVVARVNPNCRVVGVEPVGCAAMRRSLNEGQAVQLSEVDTIADGLAAPMAGRLNYEHVRALVEDVVTVTDEELRGALTLLLTRAKLLVEPAGAASIAALLSGKVKTKGPVVAVLSGGNIDPRVLSDLLIED